jgi:signal transduction histidine kinase
MDTLRSLFVSGVLGVSHHFILVFVFPLWVFPDGANLWRVVLHAGVVAMQLSVLCVFVFLIRRMLTKAEELELALAKSLSMVEQVSVSKSRFLTHMSHELRTPLVETCHAIMSARAREARIDVTVKLPPALPALRADPRAMKQVLLNLLSNAIKYTPAGGKVVTTMDVDANGLSLRVSDTGCGISEPALAKVLDPFQRGDSMVARKVEGTGLGLAISRKLMELHGGSLVLASNLGAGTPAMALFSAERLILPANDIAATRGISAAQ